MLLALVYGSFLVLIGTLATALAVLVTAHFSAAILNTSVAHDRALVRLWADSYLRLDDVTGAPENERLAELQGGLATLVERGGMLHIRLHRADGSLFLADRPDASATAGSAWPDFASAAGGRPAAQLLGAGTDADLLAASPPSVLREFLPLMTGAGDVAAVAVVWRDASPIVRQLEATRNDVLLLTSSAALLLAGVLLFIFRAAQRRLSEQNAALAETTRRDPLTGLLNHGAAVGALAERVELAGRAGADLPVALIDVDNFRLLNETHGYAVGDRALLIVSERLAELAPAGTVVGRYGPDEFVIVGPPLAVEAVSSLVERLRGALADTRLEIDGSDALPVTVSAGLATYPGAAKGVTDLLLAAANALTEAKISGGDAVRTAGARGEQAAPVGGFGILQGLIFAVDTKDRYTKRHSEDVARYALFLAQQLGLPPEDLEMIRVAGLLHDVGKVGIPDSILRKPGALTADERRIVEQHVALGDLIVRDVPDLERVRTGVRFHHERWDGGGYLDGLAGQEIPLVARILAVADTFSAMTTTRPYRKALSVSEALKRMGDAAGTQLEEQLVSQFIRAMHGAPDAPLPTDETQRPRLWTPSSAAA